MLQSLRHEWNDPLIPEQLRLYRSMVLDKTEPLDRRLTMAPSSLPLGRITCSVATFGGTLWFANPDSNVLCRCNLITGVVDELPAITKGLPVFAMHHTKSRLWMDCGECVYSMDLPDPPALAMRTTARQKTPYYFPADSDEIPANIRKRLTDSAAVRKDGLINAIGGVVAASADATGRFIALSNGVMHISSEKIFDRRRVELYNGGRYLFGGDETVCGVAPDGEGGFWIQNAMGFVHIERSKMRLREKADLYNTQMWQMHAARGSLCDVFYTAENCGNDGLQPTHRYSTSNDALWSVLAAIGDAQRYSVLSMEGDVAGARDAKANFMRVLSNVLLQSHIHRFGNGFTCRGYVSTRDKYFVHEGHIAVSGLWLRSGGHASDGSQFCRVEDTALARAGRNDATGQNFLLTPEVQARCNTTATHMVEDGFRMTVPQPAEVPEQLAKLYREADPYHPDLYPASSDDDIIFKTDTSSEEVIAAFVLYYFAWKHFFRYTAGADDRAMLALVRQTAQATLTHLLDNGFCLRDVHGNPTQWGKWFVDYFTDWDGKDKPWRHPSYAYSDGPLNAAEWMCIVRVCMQLFERAPGYEAIYRRASEEYERCYQAFDGVTNGAGYASLLGQYRSRLAKRTEELLGTSDYVAGLNYSDEELAILAYWPLLELEQNEDRHAILAAGLDEWWDNMRREENPFYSFPYAALRGSDGVDIRAGIDYLNRLPLSLRELPVTNSSRNDIVMIPSADPGEPAQANRVLPVDERRMHKANSSPFTTDIPGEASASLYDAGRVFCGSIFTLPYWTARYYDLMG